jgi:hypothetical protein
MSLLDELKNHEHWDPETTGRMVKVYNLGLVCNKQEQNFFQIGVNTGKVKQIGNN